MPITKDNITLEDYLKLCETCNNGMFLWRYIANHEGHCLKLPDTCNNWEQSLDMCVRNGRLDDPQSNPTIMIRKEKLKHIARMLKML